MEYIKKIIGNAARLKDKMILVKLPSSIMNEPRLLKEFIDDVAILTKCGSKVFLVHEYEDLLQKKLEDLNLDACIDRSQNMLPDFLNNQIIELRELIISGYISKFLVRNFNRYSVTSIGISGKDGNLVTTKKPSRQMTKDPKQDRLICDVTSVNPEIIFAFEPMSIVTIISPIAVDCNGHTSIANVDDMIAKIASSAGFDYVIYLENEIKKTSSSAEISSLKDLKTAMEVLFLEDNLVNLAGEILQNVPASVYFVDSETPNPLIATLINN